jgi:alkanesulfonate monooxygenase SsuD/methylene tetrahydromethanopterin reductase-like flavin-dependent oxidoreductase (luciferase family)
MMQQNQNIRSGLWYDLRNLPQRHQSPDRLYAEILDQIAWGENHEVDDVWLSEHQFIDDGYVPSLFPVLAAIGAPTKRLASRVLLMPLHNPVRLAEDIAVVDMNSSGRIDLGVGVRFKHEECGGVDMPCHRDGPKRILKCSPPS